MRNTRFSEPGCRRTGGAVYDSESRAKSEVVSAVSVAVEPLRAAVPDACGRWAIAWRLRPRFRTRSSLRIDAGQATAEYALVMLAAAALAGGVLAWVISSDAVARLMDAVFDSVIDEVGG